MNFDSIAGVVEQYFKIYQLRETGVLTVPMEDYLIAECEKGKTVFTVIEELYKTDKSETIRILLEGITKIEQENPS